MAPVLMITGASGFLGRACLAALAGRGYRLVAVTRSGRPIPGFDAPVRAADLSDPAAAAAAVADVRPDVLLHLAWVTEPDIYRESPANERWLEAGREMLRRFAAGPGRRAVIAGTCLEYERTGPAGAPATLYARCKDALRAEAEALAAGGGFTSAWARLFHLYGPGEHPKRLTPWLIRTLSAGRPAELKAPIRRVDFVHVADAAAALAALCGSTAGGVFDVGSGEATTIAGHAARIAARSGRPDLVRAAASPEAGGGDLPAADVRRLRSELGWSPRYLGDAGADDAIGWWRAQGGLA